MAQDNAKLGKIVFFFSAISAPVVLTSARSQPLLAAAGAGLGAALLFMTLDGTGPAPEYDVKAEKKAKQSLVMTSTGNRIARILLGAVNVAAAVSFAQRRASNRDMTLSLSGTVGMQVLESVAVLALCLLGGIWISTGYYGQ